MHTLFIDFFSPRPFHAAITAFAALSAVHRHTSIYIANPALHDTLGIPHTFWTRGRGSIFVKRCSSMCGAVYGRAARAAKIEQKIHRPPLKEHKMGREDSIVGGKNFQKASIVNLQKWNMLKIKQRTIKIKICFSCGQSFYTIVLE